MATWEKIASVTELRREDFAVCEYNNKIIIAGGMDDDGGYLNDVWESADGVNWNRLSTGTASFSARSGHCMIVHDSKLWVVGGYNGAYLNDVWCSADGVNWKLVSVTAAAFTARAHFALFSHDGQMFIVGGNNASTLSDVWSSRDGTLWNRVINGYDLLNRSHVRQVQINNRMVLIGGYDGTSYLATTAQSQDGTNWTVNGATNGLPARSHYGATVFDNKIVIAGGFDSAGANVGDVWYSADGINWGMGQSSMGLGYTIADHEIIALKGPNRLFLLFGDKATSSLSGDIWMSTGNWENRQ